MNRSLRNHNRRSLRLTGYDYSLAGAYYVSICTQGRISFFGGVLDFVLALNDAGRMVERIWLGLAERFERVELDEFVIMPNHVHGIIVLCEGDSEDNPSRARGRHGAVVLQSESRQDTRTKRRGESCIRPSSIASPTDGEE